MKQPWMKKAVIGGLALTMVMGGASAAFADGKGKGNDKDNKNNNANYINYPSNNKNGWGGNGAVNLNIGKVNNLMIKLSFDDVKGGDVEWAQRYIASLASKGVFEGYEDGTFKPRQTITRIEAITAAVRLMGLRDKAESAEEMNSQLNFKDADKIKSKYPWAVGYVSVALENDLFTESDTNVQPEKEADRLWATTLLVKALKLQEEAKAKMNTKLTFKDADKIPAGSVGYVAVALEKKLVDGYDDNTFRPNQSVTRAELAALLDRTGNQLPNQGTFNIVGTVTSAVSNNVFTINKDGQSVQMTLDPSAFIFRNNVKANASDLKVGDVVRVNLYNGNAVFVEVTTAVDANQVNFTATGTFNNYTLNSQGQMATISINEAVYGGTTTKLYNVAQGVVINGDLAQLTAGRTIDLQGSNQVVKTITIR